MTEQVKKWIVRLKTMFFRAFPHRGAVVTWQYGTSPARRGVVTSIGESSNTVLVSEAFKFDDGNIFTRSEWHSVRDLTPTDLPPVTRIVGEAPYLDLKVPDKVEKGEI